ncbi:hypothetical protein [Gloeocapsa sp. PCC 73106]|nr:hypothetical protein [Gloeocapsa sp. PCC 73106]
MAWRTTKLSSFVLLFEKGLIGIAIANALASLFSQMILKPLKLKLE